MKAHLIQGCSGPTDSHITVKIVTSGFVSQADLLTRVEAALANAAKVAALVKAAELLCGSNAMHSFCEHKPADLMGRKLGTWSAEAESALRAALFNLQA